LGGTSDGDYSYLLSLLDDILGGDELLKVDKLKPKMVAFVRERNLQLPV